MHRDLAATEGTGSGAFGYAATSRFEVGLNLYVNKDGPGSRGLRAARVRGPGLPPAGVVLTPMAGDLLGVQDWMPILRKDGLTAPEHAAPSRGGSPFFMLQRTAGLEGDEARTRRPNPFEGGTQNTVYPEWAHPLDYAQPPGSAAYVDFGSLGAMARYTFELFYEGEATPRHTLDKRLIAPVGPATDAVARRWARPDAQTLRYLDPADELAATVDRIRIGWHADPLAEPIRSVGVFTGAADGQRVSVSRTDVPRGAMGVDVFAPSDVSGTAGGRFPALDAGGRSWRFFSLRHRTLDGSQKESVAHFN